MTMLSCSRCGQRYYGPRSHMASCPFCQGTLEEAGWGRPGRRTHLLPLPLVSQGAPDQSDNGDAGTLDPLRRATR
jgi:hypothetical protein